MSDSHCSICGNEFYPRHFYDAEHTKPLDTGYGTNAQNERICFECCALDDLRIMRENEKHSGLYLTRDDNKQWFVSNWPGTLKIGPVYVQTGRHNIARTRRDCWFILDGFWWHGISLGDWSEICRVKKTKQTANRKSQIILPA